MAGALPTPGRHVLRSGPGLGCCVRGLVHQPGSCHKLSLCFGAAPTAFGLTKRCLSAPVWRTLRSRRGISTAWLTKRLCAGPPSNPTAAAAAPDLSPISLRRLRLRTASNPSKRIGKRAPRSSGSTMARRAASVVALLALGLSALAPASAQGGQRAGSGARAGPACGALLSAWRWRYTHVIACTCATSTPAAMAPPTPPGLPCRHAARWQARWPLVRELAGAGRRAQLSRRDRPPAPPQATTAPRR